MNSDLASVLSVMRGLKDPENYLRELSDNLEKVEPAFAKFDQKQIGELEANLVDMYKTALELSTSGKSYEFDHNVINIGLSIIYVLHYFYLPLHTKNTDDEEIHAANQLLTGMKSKIPNLHSFLVNLIARLKEIYIDYRQMIFKSLAILPFSDAVLRVNLKEFEKIFSTRFSGYEFFTDFANFVEDNEELFAAFVWSTLKNPVMKIDNSANAYPEIFYKKLQYDNLLNPYIRYLKEKIQESDFDEHSRDVMETSLDSFARRVHYMHESPHI